MYVTAYKALQPDDLELLELVLKETRLERGIDAGDPALDGCERSRQSLARRVSQCRRVESNDPAGPFESLTRPDLGTNSRLEPRVHQELLLCREHPEQLGQA